MAIYWSVSAQGESEAEPRRIGACCSFRQYKDVVEMSQALTKPIEIASARGDEFIEMLKLRDAHSRLHVGDFQIISKMRIDIFVVVAFGQIAQFPAEALVAGVVLSGPAVTIASPVAKRLHDLLRLLSLVKTARLRPS